MPLNNIRSLIMDALSGGWTVLPASPSRPLFNDSHD
jgi:hypothetical protein